MTGRVLDPGLQRERTSLAWTRTALALGVNGVLVMARHETAFPLPISAVLAGMSVLVALLVLTYASRRARVVHTPDHEIRPATAIIVTLGVATTLLCLGTGVAVVVWQ